MRAMCCCYCEGYCCCCYFMSLSVLFWRIVVTATATVLLLPRWVSCPPLSPRVIAPALFVCCDCGRRQRQSLMLLFLLLLSTLCVYLSMQSLLCSLPLCCVEVMHRKWPFALHARMYPPSFLWKCVYVYYIKCSDMCPTRAKVGRSIPVWYEQTPWYSWLYSPSPRTDA